MFGFVFFFNTYINKISLNTFLALYTKIQKVLFLFVHNVILCHVQIKNWVNLFFKQKIASNKNNLLVLQ